MRENELRPNWLTPGLRGNVAQTLCIVEPLHVKPGSGHPSCMGELCSYLSLQARWIIVPNYLRLATAGGYYVKPKKLLEL